MSKVKSPKQTKPPKPPAHHEEIETTDPEQYVADISAEIVKEIYRIAQDEAECLGDELAEKLILSVISSTIATLVFSTIRPDETPSVAKQLDLNGQVFRDLKEAIAISVSQGFEGACKAALNKADVEYYTQINLVPEPSNVKPC